MRNNKGFTLIELLVVIAIIALLMAMLMPALAKVREQARAVACLSQIKQWGVIFTMFTGENNDRYMSRDDANGWVDVLERFYKEPKLRYCPTATKYVKDGGRHPYAAWSDGDVGGSYTINLWIADDNGAKFWRTPSVRGAAYVPVFGDGMWGNSEPSHNNNCPDYPGDMWYDFEHNSQEIKRFCVNRHSGFVNMVFMDGTARKVGLKELWEVEFSRRWNPTNAPPPDYPNWKPWMQVFKEYYVPSSN